MVCIAVQLIDECEEISSNCFLWEFDMVLEDVVFKKGFSKVA